MSRPFTQLNPRPQRTRTGGTAGISQTTAFFAAAATPYLTQFPLCLPAEHKEAVGG